LIERALSNEFDATVQREFLPEGLKCALSIPFTNEIGLLPPARLVPQRAH
jgi:hypothetical protein